VIISVVSPGATQGRAPGPLHWSWKPSTYTVPVDVPSDKRRRHDLDLFVLALIESGIGTAYELMMAADLSPGATIPALRRLVSEGFAIKGKPGSRRRTDYKITAQGRRWMKDGWQDLIDQGPTGDLDANLRVALLALWIGHDRGLAASFLRRAAARRLSSVDTASRQDESVSLSPLALWYRRLRSASAIAQIKSESKAVLAMARALPRSASAGAGGSRSKGRS
jgi:DNA-binding PadR family transcriptional regulator